MPIRFECEACQARIKVPDSTEGRRVKCPRCGSTQRVPDQNADVATPRTSDDQAADARSVAPPEQDSSAAEVDADDMEQTHSPTGDIAFEDSLADDVSPSDHQEIDVDDEPGTDDLFDSSDDADDSDAEGDESPGVYDRSSNATDDPSDSSAIDDLVSLGSPSQEEDAADESDDADDEDVAAQPDEAVDEAIVDESLDESSVDDTAATDAPAPQTIPLSAAARQGASDDTLTKPAAAAPTTPAPSSAPTSVSPTGGQTRKYFGVTFAGWVLRILAVGLAMTVVANQFDGNSLSMTKLVLLMAGLGLAALLWGVGEIALLVRDLTRRSP